MDPEMFVRPGDAWDTFARIDDPRRDRHGAGDRAFSAGADLKRLIPLTTGRARPRTSGTGAC
jgi:enoyl-CoA hydratase/carnithine racemase